jgi:Domain of unknown function (DUF4328)/Protein of unknown function (DUF2510)
VQPNTPGGPPPGWYPDPAGVKAWRWWDGYAWTEFASDPTAAGGAAGAAAAQAYGPSGGTPPPGAYGANAPQGTVGPAYGYGPGYGYGYGHPLTSWQVPAAQAVYAKEVQAAPWARRVVYLYVVVIGIGMLQAWASSANFRLFFHNVRIQEQIGGPVPQYHQSPTSSRLSLLSLAVAAVYYVLFLIWQYRAAQTARTMALPARRSPTLGIISWFIPVVNFWFPYQSIRDCLPPGDPGRQVVARMWTFFIATLVMDIATAVTAVVGSPIAFALAVVTLVLTSGFAAQAWRSVGLITQAHYRLLYPGVAGPTS